MNIEDRVRVVLKSIDNLGKVIYTIKKNNTIQSTILDITGEIVNALRNDKKVLLCGNGGSAADAQHIAAEFSGKFYKDREPLYAEALHVNTSYLTAVANDYSYDEIYSRLIKAKGRQGDILIAISTSGNSKNIVNAINTANHIGMITIGLTGAKKCLMDTVCKYLIKIPSEDTPRIQESHILIGHIICEIIEKEIFG
ncbi:MAG TPA: SIS domain-containing protein [Syntrophorhabdaceae bacterium]|nr:SIS domain-containing protein [Syntrophorhabdaceae bacterium]